MENNKSREEIERKVFERQQKLIKEGVFTDPSTINWDGFVEYCEEEYRMETEEFLIWYENEGEEGNSDMKIWASIAKSRKQKQR